MAEITAKLVNELRSKTGLGMMECKKALTETGGDIDKAMAYLRGKGIKTSVMERPSTEGRVTLEISPDRSRGVVVEVNCNTDFAAKNELVGKIAEDAIKKLLANPAVKLGEDEGIKAQLVAAAQQTGENIQIGRTLSLTAPAGGMVGGYLYSTAGKGKIAVLAAFTGKADDELIRNVSMHIVASKPKALKREQLAADLVEKERLIAVEQAKASGKPQDIAEKIAVGKLNSFFSEHVLLDQAYANPEVFKGTVGSMLKGKGAELQEFIRVEVGQ